MLHNPDAVTHVIEKLSDLHGRLGRDALSAFVDDILTWNTRLGLVSKRQTTDVICRLVRASVSLWDFAAEEPGIASHVGPVRVVDVGSGAGFPGIIWKLLFPQLALTLIERKDRRAFFLERVVTRLGLGDVEVLGTSLHEVARRPAAAASCDILTLMAVARPRDLGEELAGLLRPGGWLVVRRPLSEPVDAQVGHILNLVREQASPHARLLLYVKR